MIDLLMLTNELVFLLTDWHFYAGAIIGMASRSMCDLAVSWLRDPLRGFSPVPGIAVYMNPRKPGVVACPKCAADRRFSPMRDTKGGWECAACQKWMSRSPV
jgi:hypothetical protein